MSDTPQLFPLKDQQPMVQFMVTAVVVLFSAIIVNLILIWAGLMIFNVSLEEILLIAQGRGEDGTGYIFKYLQAVQGLSLFIIPSILVSFFMTKQNISWVFGAKGQTLTAFLLVIILSFCLIPVTSATGILNAGMKLPDWMSGIERWITAKEETASYLTGILLESNSFTVMLLNLLVISVIPAFGEELFFRGTVQQIFYKMFRKRHSAVWVTAVVFSAVHLQFYGFLPRLILGLVYGYLFYWGGSLWLPVTAHLINNAVPVITTHITGEGQPDPATFEYSATDISIAIMAGVVCLICLMIFRYRYRREKSI